VDGWMHVLQLALTLGWLGFFNHKQNPSKQLNSHPQDPGSQARTARSTRSRFHFPFCSS